MRERVMAREMREVGGMTIAIDERSGTRTAGQIETGLDGSGVRRRAVSQRCEGSRRDRAGLRVQACAESVKAPEAAPEAGVEVAFYRKYTEALLRRYRKLRLQAGKVPSPMDREIFRGRMSHYKVQGFDDAVIFCVDVERCLGRLNGEDQRLLKRIAVQEYSMGEAAGVLGLSLRSCIVLYQRALDRTTRLFLETRLLKPENGCQEGKGSWNGVSA